MKEQFDMFTDFCEQGNEESALDLALKSDLSQMATIPKMQTIAHIACYNDLPNLASFICQEYADLLDVQDKDSQLPLHLAAYKAQPHLLR